VEGEGGVIAVRISTCTAECIVLFWLAHTHHRTTSLAWRCCCCCSQLLLGVAQFAHTAAHSRAKSADIVRLRHRTLWRPVRVHVRKLWTLET